jgi:hypothetical protein
MAKSSNFEEIANAGRQEEMANRIVAVDYGNHVRASNGKGHYRNPTIQLPPYIGKERRGVDRERTSAHFRPIRGLHSVLASLSTCLVPPRRHHISFPSNTCEKYTNSASFQIYSMPIPEPIRNTWDDLSLLLYVIRGLTNEKTFLAGPVTHLTFSLGTRYLVPLTSSGWGTGNGKPGPWAKRRHHSTMTLRIAA